MAKGYQHNVFPKPNPADKLRVRRLAERLRVWFDDYQFPVAAPLESAALSAEKQATQKERKMAALCRDAATTCGPESRRSGDN